jgi:uncharacterized protein
MTHSCLYRGRVIHTRLRPHSHRLSKRIPMMLIDLDELVQLDRSLRLFAVDRFAPFSLQARHHLTGEAGPLKAQVMRLLAESGIEGGGAVRLLCMPAVFGGVFNPLSLYLCHRSDGALTAVLYEVNNTFGGRHCYLLPAPAKSLGGVRQTCPKTFHVSPFMDMDLCYEFRLSPPANDVVVGIRVRDRDGYLMTAAFSGEREPLTDGNLAKVLLRHPLLWLEVLGAIHWQALHLWLKGLKLRPDPSKSPARRGGRVRLAA